MGYLISYQLEDFYGKLYKYHVTNSKRTTFLFVLLALGNFLEPRDFIFPCGVQPDFRCYNFLHLCYLHSNIQKTKLILNYTPLHFYPSISSLLFFYLLILHPLSLPSFIQFYQLLAVPTYRFSHLLPPCLPKNWQ